MTYLLGGIGLGVIIGVGFMWYTTIRHRRTPSLTKYVIFSLAVLITYIVAEMIVSTKTGVSHPDLSTLVGSTFGGEVLFCALIKIFKLKEDNNNE